MKFILKNNRRRSSGKAADLKGKQGVKSPMTHSPSTERERTPAYPWECDDSLELVITSKIKKGNFQSSLFCRVKKTNRLILLLLLLFNVALAAVIIVNIIVLVAVTISSSSDKIWFSLKRCAPDPNGYRPKIKYDIFFFPLG